MINKILVSGIILVFSFSANAVRERKDIELLRNANGSPKIGIQYAVGVDKLFSISFSILGSQLVGSRTDTVTPNRWAVIDKTSGAQVTPWLDTDLGPGYVTPDATLAISGSLNSADNVIRAVNTLKNSDLAIMGKHGEVRYINLQQICELYPEKFLNLDTMTAGCE